MGTLPGILLSVSYTEEPLSYPSLAYSVFRLQKSQQVLSYPSNYAMQVKVIPSLGHTDH